MKADPKPKEQATAPAPAAGGNSRIVDPPSAKPEVKKSSLPSYARPAVALKAPVEAPVVVKGVASASNSSEESKDAAKSVPVKGSTSPVASSVAPARASEAASPPPDREQQQPESSESTAVSVAQEAPREVIYTFLFGHGTFRVTYFKWECSAFGFII